MKKYTTPTVTVISLPSPVILQSGSIMDGGGDKGDYQSGTQTSRRRGYYDDLDEDEWDEE